MTKKQKKNLKRIIISLIFFLIFFITNLVLKYGFADRFEDGLASIIPHSLGWLLPFGLYLAVYFYIGHDVLWKSIRNIGHGQFLDENFLMSVATIGAFGLGIYRACVGDEVEGFDEACAVLLFYQVGEWFQSYAVGKSRKSISSLMDIRPDFANVYHDEKIEVVDPSMVLVDDIIEVYPGEKIPLDGIVIEGASTVDTKALTGESLPQEISAGMEVLSGCINLTQTLKIRVTKAFYDSTVSKILDLVENASSQKSKAEHFITKFSKFYTPIVVSLSLMLAVIPSLITKEWSIWIYRALSFLVVSCPCALVISIPLSFFAGIGAASKYGILVKGSNYLEKLNSASVFVFDKTGTLTKGNFEVTDVYPKEKKEELLELAAIAEATSSHPIAKSILACYGKEPDLSYVLTNEAGLGIVAVGKDTIYCGNEKLLDKYNIAYEKTMSLGTVVYVAKNDEFIGTIVINDTLKDETKFVLSNLKEMNAKTVMLTGDNKAIAKSIAEEIGLSDYKAELLPQNKVSEVEQLLSPDEVVCFVGDGINDAPVLMRSDIGISMGGVGSDAAIEASDIVLMQDDLNGIVIAKKIAKKTMRIVLENIIFALAVKVIILILSAFGITNMWVAVFGDVGVAVIAILNALRVTNNYKSGS
ncbi:MAG: heavy metal translocating P-type ATPase [Anaeroplasmataceae bacterium]|nr:heavy metal translocating P-type ATPase [Anaeroplasmataceae bacterium]